MIKVCSRNMCAGTGWWWWWWWGGCGDLLFSCIVAELAERREESLQSAGVFRPPEEGCGTSGGELCQLLRGERSPLCLQRPQPICFQSPAVQRGSTSLCVHKRHRSAALNWRLFPVRGSGLLQRPGHKATFSKKLHCRCYRFDVFGHKRWFC